MQQVQHARGWSFLPKLTLAVTVGLITAATGFQARATDVFTDPVGFITLTAQGTDSAPNANPSLTLYGLGMTQIPANRGAISGASSNAIVTTSTLTPGQFSFTADNNPAFFVEILDGANPGLFDDVTGNDATTIYTANQNAASISGATKYKVYPHWTIGTVFGPQNQTGLQGAGTAGAADNVQVFNPNTQAFVTYYYKTAGLGGTGWRSTTSTSINVTNVPLYVDQGMFIVRRGTGTVTNQLVGGVKLGNTLSVIVTNGLTFAGNVFAAGLPLGASGIYTGNPQTGLAGGGTAGAADNVQVWNPATQSYTTYYFKTAGLGGTGWRSTTSTSIDASTNTIPLGAPGLIVRRAGNPTFNWSMVAPY